MMTSEVKISRFKNHHVITFRVTNAAERDALDRLAERKGKSRSDLLRAAVRRLLLADLGQILDTLEDEKPEPESKLDRLSRKAFEKANWLYPQGKKRRKSKKKSEKKSGNA